MKTLKKFASIFMAAMMCFAMFVFASCGDKKETYTAYEFTLVYENGEPAKDISVQLCTIDKTTGELGMCYMPVAADENGKVTYNPNGFPGAGVYEIHLLDSAMQAVEFEGETKTTAEYAAFTLTIKA